MKPLTRSPRSFALLVVALATVLSAQPSPYAVFPAAEPPYYRAQYEASSTPGELVYAANFTVWVPPGVKVLRGVIVHQHGCGEGSCKSGLTGAYDLHWQALAKQHDCALLSPAYEQPDKADCQLWCDPRKGSAVAFQRALSDLGTQSGHPELATVPWALWGHSGGANWAGAMTLLQPDRVAAAWLRSGAPSVVAAPGKPTPYAIADAATQVPLMCNLGTQEGVTVREGRFAGVWGGVETFFTTMRAQGALIAVAVDPLTSHECGNQRYLAIPWFDACLTARLPAKLGSPLRSMSASAAFLAPLHAGEPKIVAPVPANKFSGPKEKSIWLPNAASARAWTQYVTDTAVTDTTPPPAPTNVRVTGRQLTWIAEADLESGLANFLIERDGQLIGTHPEKSNNPRGRPIFQGLQYSDTPNQPLVPMTFNDATAEAGQHYTYRVIAVNTVGLRSP